jgi:hypothetical protein
MKKIKNPSGYIGLIAILIATLVIVFWFIYLWNKQWFKGFNLTGREEAENKPVTEQLNDLRVDLKEIQDKKDKEIYDAMREEGKKAEDVLDQAKK